MLVSVLLPLLCTDWASALCSLTVLSFNSSLVQTLEWTLPYDLYKNELVDQSALMLTLSGRVSETKQVLATQFNFRLRTPDIIITVSPQVIPTAVKILYFNHISFTQDFSEMY